MVVSTKSASLYLRKSFGKDETSIIGIQQLIPSMALDPTLNNPAHDIYIVTSDDINKKKIAGEFESAAARKHPAVKILYISKRGKGDLIQPGIQGLNGYLVNPKGTELRDEVMKIIQTDSIEAVAEIQEREYESAYKDGVTAGSNDEVYREVEDTHDVIPEFKQSDVYEEEAPVEQEVQEVDPVQELEVPKEIEPEEEEEADKDVESELLQRIANARKVANIDTYMHELTASTLIKDMVQSNSTYAAIEERLKSLNNAICDIMANSREYKTMSEKLTAIRALTHDKAFIAGKKNTLLWQRLEEIVDTVCMKMNESLKQELSSIEEGIRLIKANSAIDEANARLGGLNQRRINITLELLQLQNEINSIYRSADDLLTNVEIKIGEDSTSITDDLELNARIKSQGDFVVADETLVAIRSIRDYAQDKLPAEFKEMLRRVVVMTRLYEEVLDTDREMIAAYQASINYLKAKNVEDSVVMETLLKKSLRVFTGEEGSGRTIVPYLISAYWSRQNYNVLLFDITGTGKYDSYDILVRTPEQFMTNLNEEHLCVVSGSVPNTVATGQRIVTSLLKAADYYRVINIVCRPDQKELLDYIASEVRSVNYIVEPTPQSIAKTKALLEVSEYENTGRRIILNKCNIPVAPILNKLGVDDKDVQVVTIPTIDVVTDASVRNYNPYGISSVSVLMEDVLKYVKS